MITLLSSLGVQECRPLVPLSISPARDIFHSLYPMTCLLQRIASPNAKSLRTRPGVLVDGTQLFG